MNVYAVTMTLEFSVVASSRKQAEKFARESIEERCVTLEDAEMTIAKMQFVAGSPSAHNDGDESARYLPGGEEGDCRGLAT